MGFIQHSLWIWRGSTAGVSYSKMKTFTW
jgi:hypothetical protein